jgi:hypothetical protein
MCQRKCQGNGPTAIGHGVAANPAAFARRDRTGDTIAAAGEGRHFYRRHESRPSGPARSSSNLSQQHVNAPKLQVRD